MKKISNVLFYTLIILVLCLVILRQFTGALNSGMISEATINGLTVKVKYNSNTLSGRKAFGYLVPYGIVWRTGANEATEISFSGDGTFGGKKVKKGNYSLWSKPDTKLWQVILNSQTGQYGTNYDPDQDYLHVNAKPTELPEKLENLRILLVNEGSSKINLIIRWDKTEVKVPITKK